MFRKKRSPKTEDEKLITIMSNRILWVAYLLIAACLVVFGLLFADVDITSKFCLAIALVVIIGLIVYLLYRLNFFIAIKKFITEKDGE